MPLCDQSIQVTGHAGPPITRLHQRKIEADRPIQGGQLSDFLAAQSQRTVLTRSMCEHLEPLPVGPSPFNELIACHDGVPLSRVLNVLNRRRRK